MKSLRSFLMEDWLEQNRFSARYNLGESGGRARTVEQILISSGLTVSESFEKFLQIKLHDSPNWGRSDLRQTVASFHNKSFLENVLITTGTSEALFLLFHVLKPKRLALAMPAFQLLYELPQSFGAQIIHLPVYWNKNAVPYIDTYEWIKILKEHKPDCLLINNPHNPSGLVFDINFLEELKSLVRSWNCTVIGDEHYRFLASEAETLGYTLYDGKPNTFVTGSFIKCTGTPGLRVGWCVGDHNILTLMQNEKNYTTHTVSPVIEWIAYEVLKNTESNLFKTIRSEWMQNKKILQNYLNKSEYLCGAMPNGGLVTSLEFRQCQSESDTIKLIQKLIESGVFVLPLSSMEFGKFDFHKNKVNSLLHQGFGCRLGLGIESEDLSAALRVISDVCAAF